MKKQLFKIGLFAFIAFLGMNNAIAQDGASSKKNLIGLGAGFNFDKGDFGGNLAFNHMLNPKFGIGTRIFVTPYSWDDYYGGSYNSINHKGLYFDASLAATYYLVGNYNESKFALYSGFGLGFGSDTNSEDEQWLGAPYVKEEQKEAGLSANITLGSSYKVGPGKIFLEANVAYIVLGNQSTKYTYPAGYPENAYHSPDWSQNGVAGDYVQPCLNLGYQINF
jgi:hypothetical protein